MKDDNLVHVKVEYNEAIESKKDLLSMQINLINLIKNIKRYKAIRIKELKLKNKLKRTTSFIVTNTKKMRDNLPKIKVNKISKKQAESYREEDINNKSSRDLILDRELQDIQEKLMALQH